MTTEKEGQNRCRVIKEAEKFSSKKLCQNLFLIASTAFASFMISWMLKGFCSKETCTLSLLIPIFLLSMALVIVTGLVFCIAGLRHMGIELDAKKPFIVFAVIMILRVVLFDIFEVYSYATVESASVFTGIVVACSALLAMFAFIKFVVYSSITFLKKENIFSQSE